MDNLQHTAETIRITEQEAAAMVELHSRLNSRQDAGPTVRDVAEVLHISEAEALALFNQVRAEQAVPLTHAPQPKTLNRRWLFPVSAAFLALVVLFVVAKSVIVAQEPEPATATEAVFGTGTTAIPPTPMKVSSSAPPAPASAAPQ